MKEKLKILALEPYYGGSHKIFLDHLVAKSTHNWTTITLPPWKWKWRMMHSALTFAEEIDAGESVIKPPDVIFVTDMLNLAEFKGLVNVKFADIPTVAYFHENQLTYPTNYEKRKDRYFGWINITTALAADAVWFNSEYHMNSFLDETKVRIKKAPDCRPANLADKIKSKSIIIPQGIEKVQNSRTEESAVAKAMTGKQQNRGTVERPLKILWAARWEFDKNPGDFFDAIRIIKKQGIDFRLSVIGGNPEEKNPIFMKAEKEFEQHIDHWGFLESQEEYKQVLLESEVVVSTSIHEFFGISIAEAVEAGAFPLVPKRLAYPEVLKVNKDDSNKESFFFDGTPVGLAEKIAKLANMKNKFGSIWEGDDQRGIRKVSRFYWEKLIPKVDKHLKLLAKQ